MWLRTVKIIMLIKRNKHGIIITKERSKERKPKCD